LTQAFISFFFRQPRRKKTGQPTVEQLTVDEEHLAQDVSEPQGNGETDEAQDAHDKEVVLAVCRDALDTGRTMGLLISSAEHREALVLFPKVGNVLFCNNMF
jgi:hypothetical protein